MASAESCGQDVTGRSPAFSSIDIPTDEAREKAPGDATPIRFAAPVAYQLEPMSPRHTCDITKSKGEYDYCWW